MSLLTNEEIKNNICEKNKIGEGKYRIVYKFKNYAIKILKPTIIIKNSFFSYSISTSKYTQLKFNIFDLNEFEYNNYLKFIKKVPFEYRPNFLEIYETGFFSNKSYSITELKTNKDNTISLPLSMYKSLNDEYFWKKIDELEEILIEYNIPILDIRGENILVNKAEKLEPIISDYKRFGLKLYPLQFWLHSEKFLQDKIHRRFKRLKEKYK